jgi:hypothetical protein
VPIAFAGLDPVKRERAHQVSGAQAMVDISTPDGLDGQSNKAAHPQESAIAAEAVDEGNRAINALDEPGARQFMAELAGLMGDGSFLKARRLNLRQYQLSFDRTRYTGGEVIGRLLERYEVDDLELHEPELSDIVRAIYEGRHQI